jgi:hypothetical protein
MAIFTAKTLLALHNELLSIKFKVRRENTQPL